MKFNQRLQHALIAQSVDQSRYENHVLRAIGVQWRASRQAVIKIIRTSGLFHLTTPGGESTLGILDPTSRNQLNDIVDQVGGVIGGMTYHAMAQMNDALPAFAELHLKQLPKILNKHVRDALQDVSLREAETFLDEAGDGDDDCLWITVHGNHICIQPAHGMHGKGGKKIKLTRTKERAWRGPVGPKGKLSKQERGKLGESIVLAYLQSRGAKDARPANTAQNNFPVDIIFDHQIVEVKAGDAGNTAKAQQWRLTIGQPSRKEREWLASASASEKRAWGLAKEKGILGRKELIRQAVSKAIGRAVSPTTITTIINEKTKTADLYRFSGFHERIGWKSDQAGSGYIGSFKYGGKSLKESLDLYEAAADQNDDETEDDETFGQTDEKVEGPPKDVIDEFNAELDKESEKYKADLIKAFKKQKDDEDGALLLTSIDDEPLDPADNFLQEFGPEHHEPEDLIEYSDDQPRDDHGRWTDAGGWTSAHGDIQTHTFEGGFYKDAGGTTWYVKGGADANHLRVEALSSALYQLAGIRTPLTQLVERNGALAFASQKIEGAQKVSAKDVTDNADIKAGFATDAWLAAWDVAGMSYSNLIKDSSGNIQRIDLGGTLDRRAQGGSKAFGSTVTEVKTLRDASINPATAKMFASMTPAEIRASVGRVSRITDKQIRDRVSQVGFTAAKATSLSNTLIARRDYLTKWASGKSLSEAIDTLMEYIVKVKGGYRVISHTTGKNLGTFASRAAAQRRLRQLARFREAVEVLTPDLVTLLEAPVGEDDEDIPRPPLLPNLAPAISTRPFFQSVPEGQVASMLTSPLGGTRFAQSFADLGANLLQRVRNVLVTGLIQGQGVTNVARNVQGAMNNTRFQAERIVRSEFVRTAAKADLQVYGANEDALDGVQWVATLDDDTCLECGELDGETWDNIDDAPVPVDDTHPNCRCVVTPIVKNGEELGFGAASRASMDGEVPASTTYQDWFDDQDEETQRGILGPTRYNLYQHDNATLGDFVGAHGVKSVKEVLADFAEAMEDVLVEAEEKKEHGIERYPDQSPSEHEPDDETRTGQQDFEEFGFGLFDEDDDLPSEPEELQEYSEDQPRDEKGQFAAVGGAAQSYSKYETDNQRSVVGNYQGFGYKDVNHYLRTGEAYSGDSAVDLMMARQAAIQMSHAFNNKAIFKTTKDETTVYRGIEDEKMYRMLAAKGKVGKTLVDKAFMSTSSSLAIGRDFAHHSGAYKGVFMKISVPAGTRYVRGTKEERELIFNRETALKINAIGKTKDTIAIVASVVQRRALKESEFEDGFAFIDDLLEYSDEQPRDDKGKWTSGGTSSGGGKKTALNASKMPKGLPKAGHRDYDLGAGVVTTDPHDVFNKLVDKLTSFGGLKAPRLLNEELNTWIGRFRSAWNGSSTSVPGALIRITAGRLWGGSVFASKDQGQQTPDQAFKSLVDKVGLAFGSGLSHLDQFKSDLERYMIAQYGATQAKLRAEGMKSSPTLYRGFGHTEASAQQYKNWKVGDRIEFTSGSISSFSTSAKEANGFGSYVVKIRAKPESIFSYYGSGPGVASEKEYLVIGDKTTFYGEVVKTPKEGKYQYMSKY